MKTSTTVSTVYTPSITNPALAVAVTQTPQGAVENVIQVTKNTVEAFAIIVNRKTFLDGLESAAAAWATVANILNGTIEVVEPKTLTKYEAYNTIKSEIIEKRNEEKAEEARKEEDKKVRHSNRYSWKNEHGIESRFGEKRVARSFTPIKGVSITEAEKEERAAKNARIVARQEAARVKVAAMKAERETQKAQAAARLEAKEAARIEEDVKELVKIEEECLRAQAPKATQAPKAKVLKIEAVSHETRALIGLKGTKKEQEVLKGTKKEQAIKALKARVESALNLNKMITNLSETLNESMVYITNHSAEAKELKENA